jgi:hypothetical protein
MAIGPEKSPALDFSWIETAGHCQFRFLRFVAASAVVFWHSLEPLKTKHG